MLKFTCGLMTGIVAGAVGLFIAEIITVVVLEDSPETLDYLKQANAKTHK